MTREGELYQINKALEFLKQACLLTNDLTGRSAALARQQTRSASANLRKARELKQERNKQRTPA